MSTSLENAIMATCSPRARQPFSVHPLLPIERFLLYVGHCLNTGAPCRAIFLGTGLSGIASCLFCLRHRFVAIEFVRSKEGSASVLRNCIKDVVNRHWPANAFEREVACRLHRNSLLDRQKNAGTD